MRAEKHVKKVLLEILDGEVGVVPNLFKVIRSGRKHRKIKRVRRRGFHIELSGHADTSETPARVEVKSGPRKMELTPRLRKPPAWLKSGGMESGSRSPLIPPGHNKGGGSTVRKSHSAL
jgi:hypothetical protein